MQVIVQFAARLIFLLAVIGGSLLGALATGFSGDSGPGLTFYLLAGGTALFFASGLALTFTPRRLLSRPVGMVLLTVFIGVLLLAAVGVASLWAVYGRRQG